MDNKLTNSDITDNNKIIFWQALTLHGKNLRQASDLAGISCIRVAFCLFIECGASSMRDSVPEDIVLLS